MEEKQTLFEFINMWTLDNRMSLKEFGAKCGVSLLTVLNTKKRRPANRTYMSMSDVMGIKASELYQLPITKDE